MTTIIDKTSPTTDPDPRPLIVQVWQDVSEETATSFSEGVSFFENGMFPESIECFDRALAYAPDLPEAWYNKGLALSRLGRYEEALLAYDQAVRLEGSLKEAWNNKGTVLWRLERYEDALTAFDRAISIAPNDIKSWLGRCAALASQERVTEALEAVERAEDIEPNVPGIYLEKGLMLSRLNKDVQAIWSFDQALALKSDDPHTWWAKAMSLWRLSNEVEAQEAFERAFQARESLGNKSAGLYNVWLRFNLARGMVSSLNEEMEPFEHAVRTYIRISEIATKDGIGEVVDEASQQFRKALTTGEEREALDEFELLVSLLSVQDPFDRWREFTKEISKVWPGSVSAVGAIREQRG